MNTKRSSRHILNVALLLLPLLFVTSALHAQGVLDEVPVKNEFFGEEFPSGEYPEIHSVSEVLVNESLHGEPVYISGIINDVCQKKGCWLVISDGTSQMRVTFKDYGFFVPTDSQNRQVTIRGVVSVEEIEEDLAKHYAEESKGEDPDEISGPQRVTTMVATGVMISES